MTTLITTILLATLAGTVAGLIAAWFVVKLNKPFATGGYVKGEPYCVASWDTAAPYPDLPQCTDGGLVGGSDLQTLAQLSDNLSSLEAALGPDALMADLPKVAVTGTQRAQEGGAA